MSKWQLWNSLNLINWFHVKSEWQKYFQISTLCNSYIPICLLRLEAVVQVISHKGHWKLLICDLIWSLSNRSDGKHFWQYEHFSPVSLVTLICLWQWSKNFVLDPKRPPQFGQATPLSAEWDFKWSVKVKFV